MNSTITRQQQCYFLFCVTYLLLLLPLSSIAKNNNCQTTNSNSLDSGNVLSNSWTTKAIQKENEDIIDSHFLTFRQKLIYHLGLNPRIFKEKQPANKQIDKDNVEIVDGQLFIHAVPVSKTIAHQLYSIRFAEAWAEQTREEPKKKKILPASNNKKAPILSLIQQSDTTDVVKRGLRYVDGQLYIDEMPVSQEAARILYGVSMAEIKAVKRSARQETKKEIVQQNIPAKTTNTHTSPITQMKAGIKDGIRNLLGLPTTPKPTPKKVERKQVLIDGQLVYEDELHRQQQQSVQKLTNIQEKIAKSNLIEPATMNLAAPATPPIKDELIVLSDKTINDKNVAEKPLLVGMGMEKTAAPKITLDTNIPKTKAAPLVRETVIVDGQTMYKDELALTTSAPAGKRDAVVIPYKFTSKTHGLSKILLTDIYNEDIPSHGHYNYQWDNRRVHAYKYNLKAMPDTVVFLLTHGLGGDFKIPIHGVVTSRFGPRWGRHHNGIDLDLETGDAVRAAFDGRVRIAQVSSGYGNLIIIRHFNGLETFYAHLSKINVAENQDVKAGEVIGLGGSTGRSTGSHLHFEIRYKGHPFNPEEFIDFRTNRLHDHTFSIDRSYFSSTNPYQSAHGKKGKGKASAHKHKHKHNSGSSKYYRVKRGDTLSAIARRNRTSVRKLCSLNGISTRATLRVGKKLRIR